MSTSAPLSADRVAADPDVSRVRRFLAVAAGLSAADRAALLRRYPFLEFTDAARGQVTGRFWLHLGAGWRFFAPENLLTRLIAVLEARPEVFQVGVNLADATELTGVCAGEDAVCRAPGTGRYVLADTVARGPAMFDTARLDSAGGLGADAGCPDPIAQLGRRAAGAGLRTASLDEVLCIAAADGADARGVRGCRLPTSSFLIRT